MSAVLTYKDIMLCIKPGEHGSTFGGNPLASAVAIASLSAIKDEGLVDRAAELGTELRDQLTSVKLRFPHIIKEVRGKRTARRPQSKEEDGCSKRGSAASAAHSIPRTAFLKD